MAKAKGARKSHAQTLPSSAGKARIEKLLPQRCCLGCERQVAQSERIRCGQCDTCYVGTHYAIKKGRVTADELIERGEMLPPGKGGRKPANKFTEKLQAKK